MINYKISFCTACMNRLDHLKETLFKNIEDNKDYARTEFLILDYNSKDGLETWIKDNFMEELNLNKVVYYKTNSPSSFHYSHARNLLFKLATGDILVNVNTDHFLGKSFASYVNTVFNTHPNIILTTIDFFKKNLSFSPAKDVLGKVCVWKKDFYKVKGFDEFMETYGFEDYDFVNRVEMSGVERWLIEDSTFLNFIPHSDNRRFKLNEERLLGLFVNYVKPYISELLFLFRDNTFHKGFIIDNASVNSSSIKYAFTSRNHFFEFTIKDGYWETGTWKEIKEANLITLNGKHSLHLYKDLVNNSLRLFNKKKKQVFFEITNPHIIHDMLEFKLYFKNRFRMENNLNKKNIIVNTSLPLPYSHPVIDCDTCLQ